MPIFLCRTSNIQSNALETLNIVHYFQDPHAGATCFEWVTVMNRTKLHDLPLLRSMDSQPRSQGRYCLPFSFRSVLTQEAGPWNQVDGLQIMNFLPVFIHRPQMFNVRFRTPNITTDSLALKAYEYPLRFPQQKTLIIFARKEVNNKQLNKHK